MPTYTAQCDACGITIDYMRSVSECMDTPKCCGASTRKVILHAPLGYVMGRFSPFKSPVDGSTITGTRSLEEHNKRNGVVSLADGYSDEKVKSGDILPKRAASPKKDLSQDIAEACEKVKNGYKPTLEVLNDD